MLLKNMPYVMFRGREGGRERESTRARERDREAGLPHFLM